MTPFIIGTVSEAADRYHTDAAAIWEWILSDRVLTNPDGKRVRLMADPEKRYEAKWLIEEVPA